VMPESSWLLSSPISCHRAYESCSVTQCLHFSAASTRGCTAGCTTCWVNYECFIITRLFVLLPIFLTGGRNSSPCGRNALFCVPRYQCALSDIVISISNISVDAVVDRYVSSGISGAQRRESEFLREVISIRDRVLCLPSVVGRVTLQHLSSMFVFLSFSVFIFLL